MPLTALIAAAALAIATALAVLDAFTPAGIPLAVVVASRWVAIAALVAVALRRRSLTTWILVAMVAGAEVGHDLPQVAIELRIFSQIFLRLIKAVVAPLIFATLVVGIAGHSNLRQVGRMGIKALVYFEIVTTLALFIGWGAISISRAGVGITLPPPAEAAAVPVTTPRSWQDTILHIFPENIAKTIADGEVLQLVVFSVIFAVALAMLPERKRRPLLDVASSLAETMFKFTSIVMLFAPLGVGAAIAYTVGHLGIGILAHLALLLATLYSALIVFAGGVLFPVALIARVPIRRFVAAVAEPCSIAFATTSSEAALPSAMEAMERLGVPRQIVAFVMPTGYSFNLDGTTLYLSLASIFVAQAAGIHMTLGQQFTMLVTLMLTSKGVAGVPRASLIILLGTLASFHLPTEPAMIILGIDELMDMARTTINVLGNCLATVVVARWEGQFVEGGSERGSLSASSALPATASVLQEARAGADESPAL
jgi:proton glutamate symport protein